MKKDLVENTFKHFFQNFESEVDLLVWLKIKKAIQQF